MHLCIAGPQTPLQLHRCDGVHRVRPAQVFGRHLAESQVADLAFPNQLLQHQRTRWQPFPRFRRFGCMMRIAPHAWRQGSPHELHSPGRVHQVQLRFASHCTTYCQRQAAALYVRLVRTAMAATVLVIGVWGSTLCW
jgi:hypothetical protein